MKQLFEPENQERITTFCRKNHIHKLSCFGSALHGNVHAGSDLDLLVELDPSHSVGLLGMARMEIELSELLDRKVDLRTAGELSRYFRAKVTAEAQEIYAEK